MTETLSYIYRETRRKLGLTQREVARRVGCTQSAVSMFEAGQSDALSNRKIIDIAEVLGINPSLIEQELPQGPFSSRTLMYCDNAHCLTAVPYLIGDQIRYRPRMSQGDVRKSAFCRWCGEPIRPRCPSCQSPIASGAFCQDCGEAYIQSPSSEPDSREDPGSWAEERRALIAGILDMADLK